MLRCTTGCGVGGHLGIARARGRRSANIIGNAPVGHRDGLAGPTAALKMGALVECRTSGGCIPCSAAFVFPICLVLFFLVLFGFLVFWSPLSICLPDPKSVARDVGVIGFWFGFYWCSMVFLAFGLLLVSVCQTPYPWPEILVLLIVGVGFLGVRLVFLVLGFFRVSECQTKNPWPEVLDLLVLLVLSVGFLGFLWFVFVFFCFWLIFL